MSVGSALPHLQLLPFFWKRVVGCWIRSTSWEPSQGQVHVTDGVLTLPLPVLPWLVAW